MDEQIPQYLELFLHHLFIVAFQARRHTVVLNFTVKFKLFENAAYKLCTAHPPGRVRSSTLETETDVILVRPLTDKGFNAQEMKTEPGTEAAEIF